MSSQKRHVGLCVRGVIKSQDPELLALLRHDDGRPLSRDEALEFLLAELAAGHEMLPMGEPCEGWNYKTGCPGHVCE